MLEEMGADVEEALEAISVPSYVLDSSGVVRWLNPAAERLLGDVRGRHYTSVVAREQTRLARELFTQKVLGTVEVTDTPATLLNTDGSRVDVEISSVPLRSGGHVIGVFGQFADVPGDPPTEEIPGAYAETARGPSTAPTRAFHRADRGRAQHQQGHGAKPCGRPLARARCEVAPRGGCSLLRALAAAPNGARRGLRRRIG
jgi:PAS domain S-box-containing protein